MRKFKQIINSEGQIEFIEIHVVGQSLLTTPKLNKGSAFSEQERDQFYLRGKLPYAVETLEQQVARIYQQFLKKANDLQKHVYLRSVHDTNETLFYKLVSEHLTEMLPIIYTPTVGKAVEGFSHEFRRSRGLYIAYPDRDAIDQIIDNRLNPEVDIIVITDGEGVLGIGDQGIGGMDICIAKLMVYVICGGANPHRLLPIQIDVGTNNQKLLNDPMYLGWRHPRLTGREYDEMIERVVSSIQRKLPNVYLHWEDFGRENARRNLQRYHQEMCTFNDDMQGTGVVTLSALLTATQRIEQSLTEQRIVIFGAGTAGTGIADQLYAGMLRAGLTPEAALERFWLVDRQGLLTQTMSDLTDFQRPYARHDVSTPLTDLEAVIQHVKPTVLIGCSGQGGAFTENIVRQMAQDQRHPIIFPLSNPTEKAEATPLDLLRWTEGRVLMATGSPFGPVSFQNKTWKISQCNNALIYPGLGLGIVVSRAQRLSQTMLWHACKALSDYASQSHEFHAPLLPDFDRIHALSQHIALAVAEKARQEGFAQVSETLDLAQRVQNQFWKPKYYDYHLKTEDTKENE